eukprot:1251212-Prymnesium_polylepis.3
MAQSRRGLSGRAWDVCLGPIEWTRRLEREGPTEWTRKGVGWVCYRGTGCVGGGCGARTRVCVCYMRATQDVARESVLRGYIGCVTGLQGAVCVCYGATGHGVCACVLRVDGTWHADGAR